jgi:hypothetical protein
MDIEVHGLTALQSQLADAIWDCESIEQVDTYIQSLPKKLRPQAELVKELMTLAVLDNVVETPQAREVLVDIFGK